jgi:uncharacterized membrane protein
MFLLTSPLKVLALLFALLLIGLALLPTRTLFFLMGGLTLLVGLAMLFSSLVWGIILILLGVGMIRIAVRLRARQEAEAAAAGEETARRLHHHMDPHLPRDDVR